MGNASLDGGASLDRINGGALLDGNFPFILFVPFVPIVLIVLIVLIVPIVPINPIDPIDPINPNLLKFLTLSKLTISALLIYPIRPYSPITTKKAVDFFRQLLLCFHISYSTNIWNNSGLYAGISVDVVVIVTELLLPVVG